MFVVYELCITVVQQVHVRTVPGTRVTRKPQPDLVSLPDTGQYGPELGVLNLLYT